MHKFQLVVLLWKVTLELKHEGNERYLREGLSSRKIKQSDNNKQQPVQRSWVRAMSQDCKLFGWVSAAYHMTPTFSFSSRLIVAMSSITADIQATRMPKTHIWALLLVSSSQKALPKDFCHDTLPWEKKKKQCLILNMQKIWPSLPSFVNDLDNTSTNPTEPPHILFLALKMFSVPSPSNPLDPS